MHDACNDANSIMKKKSNLRSGKEIAEFGMKNSEFGQCSSGANIL